MKTISERKAALLAGKEIVLAIGRNESKQAENLRIWIRSSGFVYMRLDCFQAYSTTLKPESLDYISESNPNRKPLQNLINSGFHFQSDSAKSLDKILEITKDLKSRKLNPW
jgi:hypothetical protein